MTLPITFPALGFAGWFGRQPPVEAGYLERFGGDGPLTAMSKSDFDQRNWDGMLIVDSAGRSFRVSQFVKDGYENGWLSRLYLGPWYRVHPELTDASAVQFADLVERVCACIQASPELWLDDEELAGEAGPGTARSESELMGELIAKVRGAKTFQQLWAVVSFEDE